jgi:outer membrane protein TolC
MRFLPFLLFALLCPAFAQVDLPVEKSDLLSAPIFPTGQWFGRHFDAPVPRVELQAPVRIEDFVVDGKLELSLRAYIELVLQNNTDIQIQKMTIETQRNAITRAFAPFDPTLTTSFRATRSNTPAQDALAGAQTLSQLTQPFNTSYTQAFDTGTNVTVGFNAQRQTTNNSFSFFNPALTSSFTAQFTQPLLRNRSRSLNRIPIIIAKNRFKSSEYNMYDQILRILQQAELAYWSVIEARENLKVQEQGLGLFDTFLKRSQRELELGAISPLEIYQPQQNYATQEVVVTQARYRLEQQEDILRRQMVADLDPRFRSMPIVLTEMVLPPTDDRPMDKEQLVEAAYQRRPDLKSILQNIHIDDLNIKQARNNYMPDLSLGGTLIANGRGGDRLQRTNVFAGDGTQSVINRIFPGGFGDPLNQTFAFDYPTYGFSLTLRLPLRDRRAAADLADAEVGKRLSFLRARNLEQTVRQEVLNAVTQVENSRASVRLAQVAVNFSQLRVDAEQKRYDLGVTTIFFVIEAQNALVRAQADLVTQAVQYRRNYLNLLRTTAQLLEERGVSLQ